MNINVLYQINIMGIFLGIGSSHSHHQVIFLIESLF